MSAVEDLIVSVLHAQSQLQSLLHGSDARTERLKTEQANLSELGTSLDKQLAISCAIGAEQDMATAIGKGILMAEQELGHLRAAMAPPS